MLIITQTKETLSTNPIRQFTTLIAEIKCRVGLSGHLIIRNMMIK